MRASLWVATCGIASVWFAGTAYAADNGIYAGLSVGQSRADVGSDFGGLLNEDILDDEDTAFKILGGYRILDWFGVEVSYVDLGEITQTQDTVLLSNYRLEAAGFNAYAVFFYDIANFDLFAKGGLIQTQIHERADGSFGGGGIPGIFFPILDRSDNTTDLAWGIGAQVRFGSLAARIEYERFEIDSGGVFETPQMISIGATWTFF
jgi:hypothetical protein